MPNKTSEGTVKVWDPLTRVFHWALVLTFTVAWFSTEISGTIHEWAGYTAGGLIAFRLVWGLVGPKYTRFSQFVRSPGIVADYLAAMVRGEERRYVGHNPAGGAMVVALLLVTLGTAVTGWMTTLDAFWGVPWVGLTHSLLANLMMAMVTVHVLGVILASLRHKENLVSAMIDGKKRPPEATDVA